MLTKVMTIEPSTMYQTSPDVIPEYPGGLATFIMETAFSIFSQIFRYVDSINFQNFVAWHFEISGRCKLKIALYSGIMRTKG